MSQGFIPLSVPHFAGNELKYVTECITTGWVSTAGRFVQDFEAALARYTGAPHAVAANSGTSALHLALRVLGLGPGDEVLVPDLTFIAPVNVVRYVGAEPLFMDADEYLNLDPLKARAFCQDRCERRAEGLVNKATGRRVRAIIVVHVFGHPADMAALMDLAEEYGLYVIEDATESLGSRYTSGRYSGRMTGTLGHMGCYSFNGNKIITTGSGGMLVTADPGRAARARYLSTQAKDDDVRYVHGDVGYNYRMCNLSAALGVAQLEELESFIEIKRANFGLYREGLAGLSGARLITEPPGTRSNYWLYSLLLDSGGLGARESLMAALGVAGIQSRPLWKQNRLQAPYRSCESYDVVRSDYFWENLLSLPSSVSLKSAEIERVCGVIRDELGKR